MSALERITRELVEVQDALLALPGDAFAERYELQRRRDRLRAEAAAAREGSEDDRPTDEIRAEVAALRSRLAERERLRIDLVAQHGGGTAGGAGSDGWGGVALNAAIDRAQGVDRLRSRVGRLEGILIDRAVDPERRDGRGSRREPGDSPEERGGR